MALKLEDIIDTARSYGKLGWAVQEQLNNIIDDPQTMDECNINALHMIKDDFLQPLMRMAGSWGDEDLGADVEELIEMIGDIDRLNQLAADAEDSPLDYIVFPHNREN